MLARRRCQDGQKRQRPDPLRPGDGGEHHHADPTQPAGFDEKRSPHVHEGETPSLPGRTTRYGFPARCPRTEPSLFRQLLSGDAAWAACEGTLNQRILRVYDLTPSTVRVNGTTASGYWEVTDDGLFQFGHSKDHRPDQPQVKVSTGG